MLSNMKTTTFFIKARKSLKLKQREVADLLKIKQVNLCKYEKGFTEPPGRIVIALAELLKERRLPIL